MTSLAAVGPRHPILITALGRHACDAATRLVRDGDLAQFDPAPRIAEFVDEGEAPSGLEALAAGDLERVFQEGLQSLDPDDAPDLPGVAWIVVAEVTGDDGVANWRRIAGPLIEQATWLRDQGYYYTLTFVLVDTSPAVRSPARENMRALAEALYDARLVNSCQIYLLRSRMRRGWILSADDQIEQTALALRVLALNWADPRHAERDLSTVMEASLQIVGHDIDRLQIFGRLALRLVRSRRGEIAEDCATERLEAFAEKHIRQGQHVTAAWEPEMVTVLAPEFTPEADASIGDRLRRGPAESFSGRPGLLRPPLDELRRLEGDADEWVDSLRQWRREVRIAFGSVLGRVRGVSARERDRVRDATDARAIGYWTDPAFERPAPYLREWLERQRREWAATGEEGKTRAAGLRLSEQNDPRDLLEAPFAALRAELSVRPNVVVMALCCGLVAIGSVAVLWQSAGNIGELADKVSWLGPEDADKGNFLRGISIGTALAIVALAGVGSFYRTRLRWDRAYTNLIEHTEDVTNNERAALQREIFLVDAHWYDKTVSAGARHLERLHGRLRVIERQLARIQRGRGQTRPERSRIVGNIGEADRPAIRERVSERQVDGLLRAEQPARQWVRGDAERWAYDAHGTLIDQFERVASEVVGDPQSAATREMRRALSEWERQAQDFLPENVGAVLADAPRLRLLYATGDLAEIAGDALGGKQDVVTFPGERDELLLCTAQLGLTLDLACDDH